MALVVGGDARGPQQWAARKALPPTAERRAAHEARPERERQIKTETEPLPVLMAARRTDAEAEPPAAQAERRLTRNGAAEGRVPSGRAVSERGRGRGRT